MSLSYEVERTGAGLAYYYHSMGHRKDGPADIYKWGDMYWEQYDILHRIGGPAVIKDDGKYHNYYIHGEIMRKTDYNEIMKNYESKI